MSAIEWTDATWNPQVGCSRISAGCDNCYAIRMANRFNHAHYDGLVEAMDWTGKINRAPRHIVEKPLRTRKPTVFFVNSMSDMFHEDMDDAWIAENFEIMNRSPRHVFQVLTKRPSRAVKKTQELGLVWGDHIWAGVSIESDEFAKSRAREIMKVPAKVRFVSAEPLLSALPSLPVADLDWIIAGGESGVGKTVRAPDPNWFRDLRDRCRAAGVPFFFKQWGSFDESGARASKKANGHLLDGEEIFEMPASAYDQMPRPDPRWKRVAATAKVRPSERYEVSSAPFRVGSQAFEDETDAFLAVMAGDGELLADNPNFMPRLVSKMENV